MTTLMIKDLSRNEELNGKAMAGVHGGRRLGLFPLVDVDITKIDVTKIHANQEIFQANQSDVVLGANMAFVEDFKKNNVNVYQDNYAQNNIFA